MPCFIGIDVGGTKIAGAAALLPEGRVLARRRRPTAAAEGGEATLARVAEMIRELRQEATAAGEAPVPVGVGLCELIDAQGAVASDATVKWLELPVAERLSQQVRLPVRLEADVRAAALAEARLGAGRDFDNFLYVTVGTGISACLVLGGVPYAGSRGLAGTIASSRMLIPADDGALVDGPPLELFASGPALASRYRARRPDCGDVEAPQILARAVAGDVEALEIVATAGEALGAAIAQAANMLDPQAVVLGGGLGLVEGPFRAAVDGALRDYLWSARQRDVPLNSALCGDDAGTLGAALAAAR